SNSAVSASFKSSLGNAGLAATREQAKKFASHPAGPFGSSRERNFRISDSRPVGPRSPFDTRSRPPARPRGLAVSRRSRLAPAAQVPGPRLASYCLVPRHDCVDDAGRCRPLHLLHGGLRPASTSAVFLALRPARALVRRHDSRHSRIPRNGALPRLPPL